jgi:hypothetical protein
MRDDLQLARMVPFETLLYEHLCTRWFSCMNMCAQGDSIFLQNRLVSAQYQDVYLNLWICRSIDFDIFENN